MHTYINIAWSYQHSKKPDTIDKPVPISFSSSSCLAKLMLKTLSTVYVCLNRMACPFRSPHHLAAPSSVISPSVTPPLSPPLRMVHLQMTEEASSLAKLVAAHS